MGSPDDSVPYYKDYEINAIRGVITSACFLLVFIVIGLVRKYRWREDSNKNDEVESETDMDSVNDYNLDGGNESKFHEDIIQTSEKRSKFDVVSVGLVASTNLNEGVLSQILLENNGGIKSSGPSSSSSGCSSRGKNSDGHRNEGEGKENFGLELGDGKSYPKTEI